jgi:hypothetical protein
MGIDSYNFDLTLTVDACYQAHAPDCRVWLDDQILFEDSITQITAIRYQTTLPATSHVLKICYHNKSEHDRTQAIAIKSIEFNGIQDPKFIWAGEYTPVYPEPWATQQRDQGKRLAPILTNTDFMGWEGEWALTFSVPVFTWIHRLKNFGTIYD